MTRQLWGELDKSDEVRKTRGMRIATYLDPIGGATITLRHSDEFQSPASITIRDIDGGRGVMSLHNIKIEEEPDVVRKTRGVTTTEEDGDW